MLGFIVPKEFNSSKSPSELLITISKLINREPRCSSVDEFHETTMGDQIKFTSLCTFSAMLSVFVNRYTYFSNKTTCVEYFSIYLNHHSPEF